MAARLFSPGARAARGSAGFVLARVVDVDGGEGELQREIASESGLFRALDGVPRLSADELAAAEAASGGGGSRVCAGWAADVAAWGPL